MDVVRVTKDTFGTSPLSNSSVEVSEGSVGYLVKIEDGMYTVEIPGVDSPIPFCYVVLDKDHIRLDSVDSFREGESDG